MENRDITFHDRREKIIVTGGTEGIGRAIALELANQDHEVAICARTMSRLEEIGAQYGIDAVQLDLGNTEEIDDFVRDSADKVGGLTVLILNAAVPAIRETSDYAYRVNRDAQMILVESSARYLREAGGRIVFITSALAHKPMQDNLPYGESKRAVEDWLIDFSAKPENQNIKVFSVVPGSVDTRMHDETVSFGGSEIKNRTLKLKESGSLRDPQVVGRIISKMSVSGLKFNQDTGAYDLPISNNDVVTITDENIRYETELNEKVHKRTIL